MFRSGQSTVGGPKWTKVDLFRPKWAKMDDFGPFWPCEYQNLVRNKVILTKMVVLTILAILVQYTFRQYCGDSLFVVPFLSVSRRGRPKTAGGIRLGHPKPISKISIRIGLLSSLCLAQFWLPQHQLRINRRVPPCLGTEKYLPQEGTNVHFSNMHFVLCQVFGLNHVTPPFHAFFPPSSSLLLLH